MDKRAERLAKSERLKQARIAAGFSSPRAAARRFGWKEETYKAHEVGRNGFENDAGRLYATAFGVEFGWLMLGNKPPVGSPPEMDDEYQIEPDFPPDPDEFIAARKKKRRGLEPGEIIEVDAIGGLGNGGLAQEIVVDGHVVDNVRAMWRVPQDFLHTELRAREMDVEILAVEGESMLPTLLPGDRVMINRRQNMLSQDGLYAIHGQTGVQVKRLQYVQGSRDPAKILIISDNPLHRADELPLDQVEVIGRVICRISRL